MVLEEEGLDALVVVDVGAGHDDEGLADGDGKEQSLVELACQCDVNKVILLRL